MKEDLLALLSKGNNGVKYFIRVNWLKLIIIVSLISTMLIIKFSDMIQHTDVPVPKDKIQDLTLGLNKFAMAHHWFRNAWLITASLSLDIQFFLILYNWLRKGFSLRIIIALIAFYAIRAVLQSIFILPFPEHIYWENPGFP